MARTRKVPDQSGPAKFRLYEVRVVLTSGPMGDELRARNPLISRVVFGWGDQTLHDLHLAVAEAFERPPGVPYEFDVPTADGPVIFVAEEARKALKDGSFQGAGGVTLDELGLNEGSKLEYVYDIETGWEHELVVGRVTNKGKKRKLAPGPSVGEAPPLGKAAAAEGETPLSPGAAADAACLLGEMHLKQNEPERAVEAFSRALESQPSADAYEGRARAHRMLAERDEKAATLLRGNDQGAGGTADR